MDTIATKAAKTTPQIQYAPVTKEMILDYLRELKPKLAKDGVTKLGLFGSYAKDEATINSDIDIVINVNDKFYNNFNGSGFAGLIYLENLRTDIENRFGKSTDLCNIKCFKDYEIEIFLKMLFMSEISKELNMTDDEFKQKKAEFLSRAKGYYIPKKRTKKELLINNKELNLKLPTSNTETRNLLEDDEIDGVWDNHKDFMQSLENENISPKKTRFVELAKGYFENIRKFLKLKFLGA